MENMVIKISFWPFNIFPCIFSTGVRKNLAMKECGRAQAAGYVRRDG